MALMYPWATKEYLLWNMTIGQIMLYYTKGTDIKNGKIRKSNYLLNKSADELRALRDETFKSVEEANKEELNNARKAEMARKYGAIDG